MNKYIGTWKLTKIINFDENGRRYLSIADYIAAATDDDEREERQQTSLQLSYFDVNEDGTANYKLAVDDMKKTLSQEDIDEAFKSGAITLSADGKFAMLRDEENLLHWELRDDDSLWMDFNRDENGKCFAKATSDDDPDCIDIMVMFRYSKI